MRVLKAGFGRTNALAECRNFLVEIVTHVRPLSPFGALRRPVATSKRDGEHSRLNFRFGGGESCALATVRHTNTQLRVAPSSRLAISPHSVTGG